MTDICKQLLEGGWELHDHKEHFGYVIPYVDYLFAKRDGKFVYVSLVNAHDDGRFLEAIFEVFLVKKNTRVRGRDSKEKGALYSEFQKKGFTPIESGIHRNSADLINSL